MASMHAITYGAVIEICMRKNLPSILPCPVASFAQDALPLFI